MTQTLIEINGKLYFPQIWNGETSWNISFITIKLILSFLKRLHCPRDHKIHYNSPTDHAIDHSSIGWSRLTIQQVFNEVWSLYFVSEQMALTTRQDPKRTILILGRETNMRKVFSIVEGWSWCEVDLWSSVTFQE